jgi:hypothetical protein
VQMVRRYIRDRSLFRENSAGKLGPVIPRHAAPESTLPSVRPYVKRKGADRPRRRSQTLARCLFFAFFQILFLLLPILRIILPILGVIQILALLSRLLTWLMGLLLFLIFGLH